MIPQFSLRSLLGFTTFICLILSALSVSLVARGPGPDGSVPHFLRCIAEIPLFFGGVTFWLVLLMPTWLPLCIMTVEARKRERVRPFLALVPAAWYCALIVLSHLVTRDYGQVLYYMLKAGAVAGTLLACWALVASSGRGKYVLSVPLGIAIVSGTISMLFARP